MILRWKFGKHLFWILFYLLPTQAETIGPIVFAVNCGGEAHTDLFGVKFEKDPLQGKVGTASDYGKRLLIARVPNHDHILYQTERYHTETFGYDIPLTAEGQYVLILKFCEVYFNSIDQKVFDVVLNSDLTVIRELDIFEKVGRGVAHDEYVPFEITRNEKNFVVRYKGADSEVRGSKIRIDFIKGVRDNPKINAMYVMKGTLDQVPKLPPIAVEQEIVEEPKEEPEVIPKTRRPSGPKQPDPYSNDDSSLMLPVFIAIGAFIPLLFCLCKL